MKKKVENGYQKLGIKEEHLHNELIQLCLPMKVSKNQAKYMTISSLFFRTFSYLQGNNIDIIIVL
jgi:hypothetical protein